MTHDLTSVEGVHSYLSQTEFAASAVFPLFGGNANFVFRIVLKNAYIPGPGEEPVRTAIFKHAEPYVASIRDFPLDTERQGFEAMALKFVQTLSFPSDTVASVPKLFLEDRLNRVLLMSDCGESSRTLKALFQTDAPSVEISHLIGRSLGTFLAYIHSSTSGSTSPGSKTKGLFQANQQGRSVAAQVSYGWIANTVSPQAGDPVLIEPPLDLAFEKLEKMYSLAETMKTRIMNSSDVLVMGDFWPGNVLISFTPDLHLDVIDWEIARPGLAGVELGQFLAEMHTLRFFHPSSTASVNAVISSFVDAYRDLTLHSHADLLDVAWVAATRLGAHLISCTPRVAWGSKEQTRQIVLEGVEYLQRAAAHDKAWLTTSIVGRLLL